MAAIATLVVSCNKEKDYAGKEEVSGDKLRFEATAAEVKTTIENGSGAERIVKWAAGDEITIYFDGGSAEATASEAGTSTTFEATTSASAENYYAVYPTDAASGLTTGDPDVLNVAVPAAQDGSFAKANIAVAKTTAADKSFAFKNATALVKFSVGDGYTKAVFTGNKGENLAGTVPVTFGSADITLGEVVTPAKKIEVTLNGAPEYYFAVLPQTFESGFSITLYKGDVADTPKAVHASRTLDRATILNLGRVDEVASITDYFVTPLGKGKKSGKSWDNAMGAAELKSLLEQPLDGSGNPIAEASDAKAALLDGVTIHMAAGDYYLAGAAGGQVKVEFNGYSKQVAITFRGGYPDGKTGTDVSGWTMPTAVSAAPANCTAFTGNGEARILLFGNQTNITFEGITFKDAKFTANGGALEAAAGESGNSTLTLTNCRIVDNENDYGHTGAGVYLSKADATITNCYFSGNKARNGAGLNLYAGEGTVEVNHCWFKGNETDNTSGAMQNGSTKMVTVNDCTFEENSNGKNRGNQTNIAGFGGAFHESAEGAKTTFNSCIFANNSGWRGGAVSLQAGTLVFNDCRFTSNTATIGNKTNAGDSNDTVLGNHGGGAIVLLTADSDCTLNNCSFTTNSAPSGNGGAIAIQNVAAKLTIKEGTTFTSNTAYNLGGVIFARNGTLSIKGTSASKVTFDGNYTLATGNSQANGGALWLGGGTISIEHASFLNNEAGQPSGSTINYSNGGVMRIKAVTSFQASDCEFSGNRGRNGMCLSLELGSSSVCKFTNCNFHDNIGRSGDAHNGTGGNFHGGVAQIGAGSVDFEGCSFTDNVAYHGSGAIHQNGAKTTVNCKNCTITGNSVVDGEGGGIIVESTGKLNLEGCSIANSEITSSGISTDSNTGKAIVRNGGAIFMKVAGSFLTAKGCTFTGNTIKGTVDSFGGVLRANDNSTIQFEDCVFDGNGKNNVYAGSCIALNQKAFLKLNNCLFKNNVSKSRGVVQGGVDALVYMNNVSFYNNTTTASGGWGVCAHFGNSNACLNNVTSFNNRCTYSSPGNCASFNGDGGWLIVNSTIIDGTPTAVVRRGGSNGRYAIFCNDVLINTNTANNTWAMNQATKFESKGHNVVSTSGTYNNAAPNAADLLSQTSLPGGAYSEQWNATPHYAVYTWTGSLSGFSAATQSDVAAAIDAYTEKDGTHTSITNIGADFKAWLNELGALDKDGRGIARTGTWWPGAYQQN